MRPNQNVARLIVTCRDQHRIIAAISTVLADTGVNIVTLDQHAPDPVRRC